MSAVTAEDKMAAPGVFTMAREFPCFDGLNERIAALMEVFPLYDLMSKSTLRGYCGFEMGVCLLLYIMEKMLHYDPCTYEDAKDFISGILPLFAGTSPSLEELEQVTEKLLNELSNYGRNFEYEYHDPIEGKNRQVKFRLLVQEPFSLPDRDTIKLRLSREGLDIIFKSREIYQDLRFSVMQFYLDQQIRRGTFEGALETVKELGVAVTNMEQELVSLRQEIRRNVVEALDKPNYRRMLNRMTQQLHRERETFDNLIKLVRETLQNLDQASHSRGSTKLENVGFLEQELYRVAQSHLKLFNHQLELNTLTEDALMSSLRSTLMVRFHLEKELMAEVLRCSPPGEVVARTAVLPLLQPRSPRILDLATFLRPQTLLSRERERPPEEFFDEIDLDEEIRLQEMEKERHQRTIELLQRIFRLLLTPLVKRSRISLSEIAALLDENDWSREEMAAFVYTALLLHQAKKIQARLPWEYTPGDTDLLEFALFRLLQQDKELASLGDVSVAAGEGTVDLPYEMNVSNLILLKHGDQAW
ncbi:hypothetical protein [Syntrophaceticus schinkii]|jgi:hypothetical protein|uniref:Uncharacterized protein n=1 Tax=Syntrophaceticus schinkii TaxID=499207 RepID=A0A0B7MGQ8_9FIRM|nr:hypothetical protein [Syntrophaceticus schinkii]CEO89235.1 hypothetical protein SSCH_420028 [Syntrophaceticus schinkii]